MTEKTCYDADGQIYLYGDNEFATFDAIRDHYANEGVTLTDGLPDDMKASDVRNERNKLLSDTDWWAVSDRTMTQAETDYRQALRDVPAQSGFPQNVTWPTQPE